MLFLLILLPYPLHQDTSHRSIFLCPQHQHPTQHYHLHLLFTLNNSSILFFAMAARRHASVAYQPLPEIGDLISDKVMDYTDIPEPIELIIPPVPVVLPRPVSLPPPPPPSSVPVAIIVVVVFDVFVAGDGNYM